MWEYQREWDCSYRYRPIPEPGDELKFFEERGQLGWELVAYSFATDEAIFKRSKNVSSHTITESKGAE